jgi:AraC-like DNA-binding protein
VNMNRPCELSAVYPRLLLQSRLLPSEQLLAGSGLTEASLELSEFINWHPQAILFRNLAKTQTDPEWAALLGTRFGISTHGPLGFAALSAPHIDAAFQVIADYLPVRTTGISCEVKVSGDHLTATLIDHSGDQQVFGWICDMVLKILESLVSTLRGRPVDRRVTILLDRPRPRHFSKLTQAYNAKLVYSAGQNSIKIPAKWLRQPSPLHDESVYRANIDKCIDTMAQRAQSYSTAGAVRHLLKRHFDDCFHQMIAHGPPPTLKQVAEKLHLTSRTLIRRLHAESTSYKIILLELRRDYADSLLCDARLTVADVGELLGYREPANFGRAFKRWHGISPAAWRRR